MSELTQVELLWLKGRVENWIRFGRIVAEQRLDRSPRVVSFAPDSVFAFVRWVSNDYGTIVSRVDILRAVNTGERYSTVPYVRPGGEILLRLSGWPKVEKALQFVDQVTFTAQVPREFWIFRVSDVEARFTQNIDITFWNFSHGFGNDKTGGHVVSNYFLKTCCLTAG